MEGGRRAAWLAVRSVLSMVLFVLLFAGLRVFAAGLRAEWSERADPRDPVSSP